jgi:hypothetical protein
MCGVGLLLSGAETFTEPAVGTAAAAAKDVLQRAVERLRHSPPPAA